MSARPGAAVGNIQETPYEGFLDDCDFTRVSGWCYRRDRPDVALTVIVRANGQEIARIPADRFRRDLLLAGKGNGRHGFHCELPAELLARVESCPVSVTIAESGFELTGSPATVRRRVGELILSPVVFSRYVEGPPLDFGTLRIDISNTCNLNCVYCPTIAIRTKDRVDLPSFQRFLDQRVSRLDNLAIGCGQEPTTSPQLCDFLDAVSASRALPKELFMLVTNGTLLHKHDWQRIAKSRLNALFISLDSLDAEILDEVRCGSKLARIQENVSGLLKVASNVRLHLNIVVTTANYDGIDEVIAWGRQEHCATFTLREMYLPPTPSSDDATLQPLVLPEGRFEELEQRLREKWPGEQLAFANRQHLEEEYEYWAPKLL
jgi:molybdenum cofactor biosynthesis enzyme MoaA